MQEIQWLVWIVGFVFFIPLHVGLPLLYLLVQDKLTSLPGGLRPYLLESSVVALLVYAIAAWVWGYSVGVSITLLVGLMLHPWIRVWRQSRTSG